MKKLQKNEIKVGLFATIILLIVLFATIRVSQEGLLSGGTYTIYAILDSAEGLTPKTPVEIAGIQVGNLGDAELIEDRRAKIGLNIDKGVNITRDVVAQVRTKGFLGESYIDLRQGRSEEYLEPGDTITATNPFADLSQLSTKLNEVASDVQEMTSSIKTLFQDDEKGEAPVKQMILNMRDFTKDLKDFTHDNKSDMNRVVENLAALTDELRILVVENRGSISNSMEHIQNIARKIDEGRGTIGRLINDETTIDNLNTAIDNLNQTIGGFATFQFDIGYHLEYLGRSKDFKNYIELGLRPRPDRAFLLEFVADSNPSPERETVITDVTTGGTTTTVTTDRQIIKRDEFLFSAQIAQDVGDFTIRGGLIESRAGFGFDWQKKFFKASFSAFDFRSNNGQRPHLKAWGTINLNKNLFVLGGIDDPLNPDIETDWFIGAGFRFIDDDIKSLLGLGASAAR